MIHCLLGSIDRTCDSPHSHPWPLPASPTLLPGLGIGIAAPPLPHTHTHIHPQPVVWPEASYWVQLGPSSGNSRTGSEVLRSKIVLILPRGEPRTAVGYLWSSILVLSLSGTGHFKCPLRYGLVLSAKEHAVGGFLLICLTQIILIKQAFILLCQMVFEHYLI